MQFACHVRTHVRLLIIDFTLNLPTLPSFANVNIWSHSPFQYLKLMSKNQMFCILIQGDELWRLKYLGKINFWSYCAYFGVKFLSPWFSVMRFSDLRIKITVLLNLLFCHKKLLPSKFASERPIVSIVTYLPQKKYKIICHIYIIRQKSPKNSFELKFIKNN